MKAIIEKARQFGSWLWSFLGDSRTKNAAIVILLILTGFGMIAPDRATSMRDTITALAF